MTLKEIEKKAYTLEGKTIDPLDTKQINQNIIKILRNCLDKNIKFDITEKDYLEIINIYYSLYHKYYDDFLKQIADNSINKINLLNVINKL